MNKETLLLELVENGVLKSQNIRRALDFVDRKDFLPSNFQGNAYINSPIPIGFGQTNSQPLTVVFMLELLMVESGNKILDIGSGSGWTTALLAFLTGEIGQVTGLERVPKLVEFGKNNLTKYNFKHAKIAPAQPGDLGIVGEKFDRILVSASYPHIPPELLDQLEIGGIMVIPVQESIWKIKRTSETGLKEEEFFGFNFVPLIK